MTCRAETMRLQCRSAFDQEFLHIVCVARNCTHASAVCTNMCSSDFVTLDSLSRCIVMSDVRGMSQPSV